MGLFEKLFNWKKQDKIQQNSMTGFDTVLFESNLQKWKKGREENNENPDDIKEIFSFLLENNLFSSDLNEKLDEYFQYGYHLGEKSQILTALLVNNSNSFCYEAEADCLLHPVEFNAFYNEHILPILKNHQLQGVKFSYSSKEKNGEFEYLFTFGLNGKKFGIYSFSDVDFLDDFFIPLNELFSKTNIDKRFYDFIGTTKILLDKNQEIKLKNSYNIVLDYAKAKLA